jgi:hypothetical protein
MYGPLNVKKECQNRYETFSLRYKRKRKNTCDLYLWQNFVTTRQLSAASPMEKEIRNGKRNNKECIVKCSRYSRLSC